MGLPVYAECGGLMYLTRAIHWGERRGEMVGVIPADCTLQSRPVGRGYARFEVVDAEAGLAPEATACIAAHEFHHSQLTCLSAGPHRFAYRMSRGVGIDGAHDGFIHRNLLASYCHRRGSGAQGWIAPFLTKVRRVAWRAHTLRQAA